jgi:LysM repeat protein
VRKWITSACAVLACSIILLFVAVAASIGPSRTTQANTGTASYTQATLASHTVTASSAQADTSPVTAPTATWTVRPGDTLCGIATDLAVPGGWQALYAANRRAVGPDPNLIRSGTTLILPGNDTPTRYAVAPGDTLSGIAVALAVPGGWQALYAANRQAIGPNPGVIRAGTVLVTPQLVVQTAPARMRGRTAPASAGPSHQATPAHKAPLPVQASPQPGPKANANPPARGMPQWLKFVLFLAGLLAAAAFATEPVAAFFRRRRATTARHAGPPMAARADDRSACAIARARIILADHERLVVTYSIRDDTVYVLTPPGEDPQVVLRAARLVVPEGTYKDLADHLGVPSAWQRE